MTDDKDPDDDIQLFYDAIKGVKPLVQDKLPPHSTVNRKDKRRIQKSKVASHEQQRLRASFQFSDGYEAYFAPDQPLQFSRDKTISGEVKRLRRGEYPPDMTLDLHGYTRDNAKWTLAEFLHEAKKYHSHCVCIIHGRSGGVLRKQLPNWLVQHPDVLGFHEAPLLWGGKGALLVLLQMHQ
ncbi:MAG: endonuclease SmrB [Aestuariibacter sp.]